MTIKYFKKIIENMFEFVAENQVKTLLRQEK